MTDPTDVHHEHLAMTMLRLAVAGCLALIAPVFLSSAHANFRGGRLFRAPACCQHSVESSCGGYGDAADAAVDSPRYPVVVEEPAPVVHNPVAHAPIVHHPVVTGPIHHGPIAHPPVIHSPVPPHPIYDYMWAGPYYYGVPHYYDPSWDRNARTVHRGPVAKGRPETYPALPYSEFAAQQALDAPKANPAPQADATRATIVVRVPSDDAKVFIEGQLMTTMGRVRTFMTPPLAAGKVFEMEIRGEFQGDQPHTKRIELRAGQVVSVELGR